MRQLIFNELSFKNKVKTEHDAKALMENLISTCKSAYTNEFKNLRMESDAFYAELAEGYSIFSWLRDKTVNRTLKDTFMSIRKSPCLEEDGDEDEREVVEEHYINYNYFIDQQENLEFHNLKIHGLAISYLYDSLAVSLANNRFWEQCIITLRKSDSQGSINILTRNISTPLHVNTHKEWIDEWRSITLIESSLDISEKSIELRDDHGKDVLTRFAKRLIKIKYVNHVINSLPFNPKETDFIKEVYGDGKIELVLTKTDQGLGLVVQTTGRDLAETQKIAEHIKKKFI